MVILVYSSLENLFGGSTPPSQIKVYSRVLRFNLPYNVVRHCGTPALRRKIYSNLLYSCIFQPTESHPLISENAELNKEKG